MLTLKFALRSFARTPFVTAVAVLSLALGIGANTAIFTLFNQILLQPLPVSDPASLVNLSAPGPKPGSQSCNLAGDCDVVFSYPMFRDLEKDQKGFTGLAAHRIFGANLASGGETVNGQAVEVSGSYFPLLGIHPEVGRLLGPDDDRVVGGAPVAVLSHTYWTTHFAANPDVVGRALTVNGQALTIVGVAPEGFDGTTLGAQPFVFVPITLHALLQPQGMSLDNRRHYWVYVFGRLAPGVTIEQARAAIDGPYQAILKDVEAPLQTEVSPQTMRRFLARTVTLDPGAAGQTTIRQTASGPLILLMAVAVLVLLIACANIANLLLARAAGRTTEIAVRLALGASRAQLVGQLLFESCLLAVTGGIGGLLVARWTLAIMKSLLSVEAARTVADAHISGTVLLFATVVTLGTGLLFGLFPAVQSTRPDVAAAIKSQAGHSSGARAAARFRSALATTQIALAMALLGSAGLFTQSLLNVSRVDLGVKADHLFTFGVAPQLNGYAPERSAQLFERLEDALAALPGVTGVTSSRIPLLTGSNSGSDVAVEGFQAGPDTDSNARYNVVGPGYFSTMGTPILAGREFTRDDTLDSPKVSIVNETFAKKFDLGPNPVGKHMGGGDGYRSKLDTEIVGLVKDSKYSQVKDPVPPIFFRPYRQDKNVGSLYFYVRTALDPGDVLPSIPRLVAQIDPTLPVENLRTMPEQIDENVTVDRVTTIMSAAFALLATLLAAIGLYGVLAYTVAQRTREIGLRMALGADAADVRRMVLGQVAVMLGVGGAVGLAAAVGLSRIARSMLFQLNGGDLPVLAASAVALALVAFAAAFVPAYRASRVHPMEALRYE